MAIEADAVYMVTGEADDQKKPVGINCHIVI